MEVGSPIRVLGPARVYFGLIGKLHPVSPGSFGGVGINAGSCEVCLQIILGGPRIPVNRIASRVYGYNRECLEPYLDLK